MKAVRPLAFMIAVAGAIFMAGGCVAVHVGSHRNRTSEDGIYSHEEVALGKSYGMTCIPGFSYAIQYDAVEAAANGDNADFEDIDDLGADQVATLQKQYTDVILDGLNKAVAKQPPKWVKGQAVGLIRPNYFPG